MTKSNLSNEDKLLLPGNMIGMYANGAFPMADEITGEIRWYQPENRAIIPLDDYNIPKSLKKFIEKTDFEIRYDYDFQAVVKNCANRNITWISPKLIEAYLRLHKLGHIHTVEVYQKNKLVGGLYGVTYRGAFFGESMFSKISQASKVALVKLFERLKEKGFVLLDVQFMTDHLKMFGAKEISFEEYDMLLGKAYFKDIVF